MVGLALAYMLNLQEAISLVMWSVCQFETYMVSAERCYSYTEYVVDCIIVHIRIKSEEMKGDNEQPINWPTNGEIIFSKFSVKYRPNLELVLKDISFHVEGGEKVIKNKENIRSVLSGVRVQENQHFALLYSESWRLIPGVFP